MSIEHEKLKDILAGAAAQTTPDARAAYLDGACGGDAELRARVEGLLQAHDLTDDFLEQSVLPPTLGPVGEAPGTIIGRYKLLQEIGQGGFGLVFMAEQLEPVQRKVALKIIKAGMDTREVIARFEAERQALALMDHPNIARVLDAGATETGRPYFVMELVKGIKITDYCDQNNLATEERLALFMKVCHAIQHAHQKGIIHRDLKPSNVMITLHDGEPVPKVIDFGIAKATGQRLTDKTLFTRYEQMIGTPAYMSPEQAALSGLDIDTRTDIYALGVLLYELLTGVTPFDTETLAQAAFDEIRRMIRETEPAKPSTRLLTMGEKLTEVARHRHTEPAVLSRLVRGDLDWIVMKALDKDRTRRYETPDAFAVDIQHFMADEPVKARPPSTFYRFRKSVRRNKLAFVAGVAIAAAIIAGLGISTWRLVREKRALERAVAAELEQSRLRAAAQRAQMQAEANEEKAREEAATSKQVTQFLNDTLQSIAAEAFRDRDVIRSILDATTDRIGKELSNQPEVEAELRTVIGLCYSSLLRPTEAETMFREVLAIDKELFGNESLPVAASLERLADELSLQGKHRDAEIVLRQSLAMSRKLVGDEHRVVADALDSLVLVLLRQSQTALAPQKKALLAEAERLESEALTTRRKLFGDEHLAVAASTDHRALVLGAQGKTAEAERGQREALAIRRKLLGDENWWVALSFLNLADVLTAERKYGEAEHLYRDALAMRRKLLGDAHPDVANALGHLAALLQQQGNLSEAEAANREALAIHSKEFGNEHSTTIRSLVQLANVLRLQGKLVEAESFYRKALNTRRRVRPEDYPAMPDAVYNLGGVLERQGKYAEAEALYRELLELQRPLLPLDDPDLASSLAFVAMTLVAQDKFAEAEPFARESLTIREQRAPDNWQTFNVRSMLGGSLLGQEKYAEAEPLLLSAYEAMKQREDKIPAAGRPRLLETLQRLVQLYEATDRPAQAADWKRKVAEFEKPKSETNPPARPR